MAYWPTVIPHGPYSTTPDAGAVMDIELGKPDLTGLDRKKKAAVLAEYSRRQRQRFVNLIEYMDKLIGKLIARAEELDIYENTYFIFCSEQRHRGDRQGPRGGTGGARPLRGEGTGDQGPGGHRRTD